MDQLSLPGRRFRPLKAPPPLETATQIALADLLRVAARRNVRWTYSAAGEYRTKATAALLKRKGVNPGWPDFQFLDAVGVAFIELKRGKRGVLSEEQAAFGEFCREQGHRHAVCCSFDEAEAVLRRWGMLRAGVREQDAR